MHHDYKKHMIVSEFSVKCSLEKKTSGSILKKAFILIDYDELISSRSFQRCVLKEQQYAFLLYFINNDIVLRKR